MPSSCSRLHVCGLEPYYWARLRLCNSISKCHSLRLWCPNSVTGWSARQAVSGSIQWHMYESDMIQTFFAAATA